MFHPYKLALTREYWFGSVSLCGQTKGLKGETRVLVFHTNEYIQAYSKAPMIVSNPFSSTLSAMFLVRNKHVGHCNNFIALFIISAWQVTNKLLSQSSLYQIQDTAKHTAQSPKPEPSCSSAQI